MNSTDTKKSTGLPKYLLWFAWIPLMFSLQSCAKEADMSPKNDTVETKMETDSIVLGMGCFWGAEKRMSELMGVVNVESGYAGGDFEKVGYQDILNHERMIKMGRATERNHAEVIKVTFNPALVSLETVLIQFWENHNPTQGDRQGNDVGTNYRSAVYYKNDGQKSVAEYTKNTYQTAITKAGLPAITTEITSLKNYNSAEEYHQDYLVKNPNGYCGLGGTGVAYPGSDKAKGPQHPVLNPADLNLKQQLVVFEAEECPYCKQFKKEIMDVWKSEVAIIATLNPNAPTGWKLEKTLFATPTIVLFENGKEKSRFTGYNGDKPRFWKWLGFQLLTPEQQKIAFEKGTEYAFTGSHLDEKRPGTFVDPITGEALFRSDTKFESNSGWPSFFNPVPGAITEHEDRSHGMSRVEVRSTSSGIHLGHVFPDGPAPTYKRYCINGNVLKFVPDEGQ